ncbi:ABC transporter substrate-binding protein [Mesoplasma corruscae]|uniref:Oligopeptide ABC transporter substrate-binding protein n=1 Tax=Mesoplasma corruscae TaxID=216874 RepID=A0A2S5RHF0_9MOLU|nr:ABC transporter substrate-binding protein [Mesoplasma corruscae]PPE06718.1 oligopeptide ABC transporter substrate-binding protein [Mesoplasma corruscae]
MKNIENNKNLRSFLKSKSMPLLLISTLTISASSLAVVSCNDGIALSKLANRSIDTSVRHLTFETPPTSWNPVHNNDGGTTSYLADLFAGALSVDQFGRIYGDAFESGYASAEKGGKSIYVGNDSSDETIDLSHWTYTVRDNAYWSHANGQKVRKVKASDWDNTAMYVLNLNSQSAVYNLWTAFILNTDVMQTVLSAKMSALNANKPFDSNNYYKAPVVENNELKSEGTPLKEVYYDIVREINSMKENGGTIKYNEVYATGSVVVYDPNTLGTDGKPVANSKILDMDYVLEQDPETKEITWEKDGQRYTNLKPVKLEKDATLEQEISVSAGGYGLITNDETRSVEFKLKKEAPYFETLLTYIAFSPLAEEIVKGGKLADGQPSETGVYSGAYLPTKLDFTKEMIYEANPNYYFRNLTTITKQIYTNVAGASTSSETARLQFEKGEREAFGLSGATSGDKKGWAKYIGSDSENPIFPGVQVGRPISASSEIIIYNYYNGYIDNPNDEEHYDTALSASKLLQLPEARAFISTGIDRSRYIKQLSEEFDTPGTPSKNIINLYTSQTTATNAVDQNKDYVEYFHEQASQISGLDSNDFAQGGDAFLNQSKAHVNKEQSELIDTIKEYIKINNLKTVESGEYKGRVRIGFLNGGDPYLNSMLDQFNSSIPNNPIYLELDKPVGDEGNARVRASKWDIYTAGWLPDYADPYTYLSTTFIKGDYTDRFGGERILNKLKEAKGDITKYPLAAKLPSSTYEKAIPEGYTIANNDTSTANQFATMFATSGEGNKVTEISRNAPDSATQLLLAEFKAYEDNVKATDLGEVHNITKRYNEFSKAEYDLLYKYFLILPLYNSAAYRSYSVNYIRNQSGSYATYGSSSDRTFLYKLNEKLWSRSQNRVWINFLNGERARMAADPTYKKEGNSLFIK